MGEIAGSPIEGFVLEDSDWSSKGLAEVKLAMSGISPSLLHSIKLKQSAPVRVSVFPYTGGPRQRDARFPLHQKPCLAWFLERDWVNFQELSAGNLCAIQCLYIWWIYRIHLKGMDEAVIYLRVWANSRQANSSQTFVVPKWDDSSCVCHINWAGFLPWV